MTPINANMLVMILLGVLVGIGASFSGLGGWQYWLSQFPHW